MNASLQPSAPRLGHVHLRVADLERATRFYRDVLGLSVTAGGRPMGLPAVFLASGDYHHYLGLNTFLSADGTPPPAGHTGLHHVAFAYGDRAALADAVRRVQDAVTRSSRRRTTARPSRSTCEIPRATASSSTTTGRARCGSTSAAGRSSRPSRSRSTTCSMSPWLADEGTGDAYPS